MQANLVPSLCFPLHGTWIEHSKRPDCRRSDEAELQIGNAHDCLPTVGHPIKQGQQNAWGPHQRCLEGGLTQPLQDCASLQPQIFVAMPVKPLAGTHPSLHAKRSHLKGMMVQMSSQKPPEPVNYLGSRLCVKLGTVRHSMTRYLDIGRLQPDNLPVARPSRAKPLPL